MVWVVLLVCFVFASCVVLSFYGFGLYSLLFSVWILVVSINLCLLFVVWIVCCFTLVVAWFARRGGFYRGGIWWVCLGFGVSW